MTLSRSAVIMIGFLCNIYIGPQHKRQHIFDYKDGNEKYRGVALLHNERLGHYKSQCTGALITPPKGVSGHFVLTAAHCFWDRDMTDPDRPDHPDPNFKKWRPEIDQLSFHFGVLKQGKLGGDAVDCRIEKVMIPKNGILDIAVVKLKDTPPDYPFQLHEFIDEENHDGNPFQLPLWALLDPDNPPPPATTYTFPGYGGRRRLEVTTLTFDKKVDDGIIKCNGAARPGDSGGPILNADGKIVGVMKEIYPQPTISQEPKDENGGAVLPKLEQIEPSFTAMIRSTLNVINTMMKGQLDDYSLSQFEIKTFGAKIAYYGDGLFSIFCSFEKCFR